MPTFRLALPAVLIALATVARAQQNVNWPVYGGSDDHTHYTTLAQITPANVRQLTVAWTYETHDEFAGSEMQTNPIVIDGVLYGTSPKLRVFALDATSGKELWSFDPTNGAAPTSRIRHRGVVVTGDRGVVDEDFLIRANPAGSKQNQLAAFLPEIGRAHV